MEKNYYRSDIQFETKDYKLANMIRMMKYENKKYQIIDSQVFDENGDIVTVEDTRYDFYDSYYKLLIPLWETPQKNAEKHSDLYNDRKWIIGKRENKRAHQKLLIFENGYKMKIGFLWSHQPFNQRPTYNKKFVKMFYAYLGDDVIIENENWGAILSQVQQYIKDNSKDFYDNYKKIIIKGHCKSENIQFKIVEFDILESKWFINRD